MFEPAQLVLKLEELGIRVVGTVVRDAVPEDRFLVFVGVTRSPDNKQVPSNRKLNDAREVLAEFGVQVEFLLHDPQANDIEAGLRATLLHAFSDHVRSAYMSVTKGVGHVYLDPKKQIDDDMRSLIRRKAEHFLTGFDIKLGTLEPTVGEAFPGTLACLSAIRQMSPVTVEGLSTQLVKVGFVVPSIDWLTRRLDVMRRNERIVRLEGGSYALALATLRALGTKKNRESPDIARLLALARRRL